MGMYILHQYGAPLCGPLVRKGAALLNNSFFSSVAQKIHITESTKEALDKIGVYNIVFRCSMEVKVRCFFFFHQRIYSAFH